MKYLICFCFASAIICAIGGDFWAAAFCAFNATVLMNRD